MTTRTKLTYQDYLDTPDDQRYELLDGVLILAPAPNIPHQDSQAGLGSKMRVFADQGDLGSVFFAPTDIVLSETDVVQPDIVFVSHRRAAIVTEANVQGAPDLVIEILSPSTSRRDWRDKRELYAEHGVREYWTVDTSNHLVYVMLLRDGVLEIVETHTPGDTIESATLVGFRVGVDDIFARESTRNS